MWKEGAAADHSPPAPTRAQIEHHLFPGISQYHYPAIAPMVKAICKKHGVRYNYEPTFVAAWSKHVHMLYKMGEKGFAYKVSRPARDACLRACARACARAASRRLFKTRF